MNLRSKVSLLALISILAFLKGCGSTKKSNEEASPEGKVLEAVQPEVANKAKEDEALNEILGVYPGLPEQDAGGDFGGPGSILIKMSYLLIVKPNSDLASPRLSYSLDGLKILVESGEEFTFSEDKKTITAPFGVFVREEE